MSSGAPLTFSSRCVEPILCQTPCEAGNTRGIRHRKRKADGSALGKRPAKGYAIVVRHAARSTPHACSIRPQYHCNHCKKDVSGQVRIRCAVCSDFDLCIDCFRVGIEVRGCAGNAAPHLNMHNYRVIDNLRFPLYHPSWGVCAQCHMFALAARPQADEELLLLEAIDNSGLGNWTAVAEATGSKSEAECRRHYHAVYVEHDAFPLPKREPEMQGVCVMCALHNTCAFGNPSITMSLLQIRPEDYLHSVAKFEELAARFARKPASKALADGYVTAVRQHLAVLCK